MNFLNRKTPVEEKPKPVVRGITVCWSMDPRWSALPIINLPSDAVKVRRKVRVDAVAKCYVKRAEGSIEEWILQPVGADDRNPIQTCFALKLGLLQKVNRVE